MHRTIFGPFRIPVLDLTAQKIPIHGGVTRWEILVNQLVEAIECEFRSSIMLIETGYCGLLCLILGQLSPSWSLRGMSGV